MKCFSTAEKKKCRIASALFTVIFMVIIMTAAYPPGQVSADSPAPYYTRVDQGSHYSYTYYLPMRLLSGHPVLFYASYKKSSTVSEGYFLKVAKVIKGPLNVQDDNNYKDVLYLHVNPSYTVENGCYKFEVYGFAKKKTYGFSDNNWAGDIQSSFASSNNYEYSTLPGSSIDHSYFSSTPFSSAELAQKSHNFAAYGFSYNGYEFDTTGSGHTFGNSTATCTEAGVRTCSVCGITESTPALGHLWNEGAVTAQPDVYHDGVRTFTCTRAGCGATRTEPVPHLHFQIFNGGTRVEKIYLGEGLIHNAASGTDGLVK